MTRPGDLDVIAAGAGGMGPCPPPQHQPPDGVCTHIIICIHNVYTKDVYCISQKYTIYILGQVYTWYILRIYNMYSIYNVYTKDNYVVYSMNILGI
jgi:hypothetical protein